MRDGTRRVHGPDILHEDLKGSIAPLGARPSRHWIRGGILAGLMAVGCNPEAGPVSVQLEARGGAGVPEIVVRLNATGSGSSAVGQFDIVDSVGTLEFGGTPLPALVYKAIQVPTSGSRIYQGLAFGDRELVVFWFYCTEGVDTLYVESTFRQPMAFELASGNCDGSVGFSEQTIEVPNVDLDIELASGFTIDGPGVTLDRDGVGVLSTDDQTLEIYLFEVYDCTYCRSPGWWELHVVLYDPETRDASFGIFYLYQDELRYHQVEFYYAFSISQLRDPIGPLTFRDSVWTAP